MASNLGQVPSTKAPDKIKRDNAGAHSETGLTGLVVLAYLGAGYTLEEGKYKANLNKAINWLIAQQKANGDLSGQANIFSGMYCHAMATLALAEAYGMKKNKATAKQLETAVRKGIEFIISRQYSADGGWRYKPEEKGQQSIGDMSLFGWQLMAIKSAEIAGISIPPSVKQKCRHFMTTVAQGKNKGLASYQIGEKPTPVMTSEALFCKQLLRVPMTNDEQQEAIDFIMKYPPKVQNTNYYYWYYGTLALHNHGGDPWKTWNSILRDQLVNTQITTGKDAGSWAARDPWGGYGGKIYSTVLATLSLEVYYRFPVVPK